MKIIHPENPKLKNGNQLSQSGKIEIPPSAVKSPMTAETKVNITTSISHAIKRSPQKANTKGGWLAGTVEAVPIDTAVPHFGQNCAPSGSSAPQLLQFAK